MPFEQTHQNVHIKYVQFFIYQLCHNKVVFGEKKKSRSSHLNKINYATKAN